MIEVIDLLTRERKRINPEELIVVKRQSPDFILSIPHSGTLLLSEMEDKFNIGKHLVVGADLFTDKLYNIGGGILIVALLNRYLVENNRFKEGDNDSLLPEHLKKSFLLKPDYLSPEGDIILKKSYTSEERDQLLAFYIKYHDILQEEIKRMKDRYGFVFMLDCHSMAPKGKSGHPDEGKERPDFTVGSVDDSSAHPRVIAAFYEAIKKGTEKHGFTLTKNYPYKGGAITRMYGSPSEGIHVLQLEVNKARYIKEGIDDDGAYMPQLSPDQTLLIKDIIKSAVGAAVNEARKLS